MGKHAMDFGIGLPAAADSWTIVKAAEELGFTHAWFYDTQMLTADCFVAMAAAAVNTRRIRLGTGVLVPSNRIAPVAANALASLNKLAPSRIDFGIGTGFTARRAMGFGAVKMKAMEAYIAQIYGLLRGETVDFEMEGERRKIRFLNPELGLFNTCDPIKLHLSAYVRARARSRRGLPPAGSTSSATSKPAFAKSRRCARNGKRPGTRSAIFRPPPSRSGACSLMARARIRRAPWRRRARAPR
jgi:hypothetical protein